MLHRTPRSRRRTRRRSRWRLIVRVPGSECTVDEHPADVREVIVAGDHRPADGAATDHDVRGRRDDLLGNGALAVGEKCDVGEVEWERLVVEDRLPSMSEAPVRTIRFGPIVSRSRSALVIVGNVQ